MDNKKHLPIFIITAIILFIAGLVMGIYLGYGLHAKAQSGVPNSANKLYNKTVSSIMLYGQVKNVQGSNITLDNMGDALTVSMAPNSHVFALVSSKNNKTGAVSSIQQAVTLGDIKTGDNVNIVVELSADGQIQGLSAIILPAIGK